MATPTEVNLCSHLLDSGLQQPHALYVTKRRATFACPSCLCDLVERRLEQPNGNPHDAAQSCHFTKCQCAISNERACWTCLSACVAELTSRWARLFHTDKARANQLLRIRSFWNRHFDPNGIRQRKDAPEKSQPRRYRTLAQIADDVRTRKDVERIAKKRAAILRERRLPKRGTLQMQRPQVERIEVIPA